MIALSSISYSVRLAGWSAACGFSALLCQKLESWQAMRPEGQQVWILENQTGLNLQTFQASRHPSFPASWQEIILINFNVLNGLTGQLNKARNRFNTASYPLMILGSIIWCCGQMDLGF